MTQPLQSARSATSGLIRAAVILTAILAVYIFNVERWHPGAFFGRLHDDSIYFSTAKALAQGQGYVLASFPDSPAQTKYPILYPWVLSWVWRANPHFPENLPAAIHVTEFFGCWSLLAGFFLLRRLPGLGVWAALSITAVCAFQPIFLRMSGTIMSDVPFMAMVLTALVLSDAAIRPQASALAVIATAVFSALSMGMRTVGVTVIAGIFVAAVYRRAYRSAILFAVVAGALVFAEFAPTLFHKPPTPLLHPNPAEPGWNQVLAYYTDYVGYQWRMGVPTFVDFIGMVELNFLLLLSSPGSVVAGPVSKAASAFTAVLSVPILLGLGKQRKLREWLPIFFVLFFYCALLLVWPFPQSERFLLPILPLLFAGIWLEMSSLRSALINRYRAQADFSQRVAAGGIATVFAALFSFILWNYAIRDPRILRAAAESQEHALAQRMQAYTWIREHTPPDARIAAYNDPVLHLYTGRQSLRPVVFLPAAGYMSDEQSLRRDLDHITDAARHVGARYWLTTADDFNLEVGRDEINARTAQIMDAMPVLFASDDDSVKIHYTGFSRDGEPHVIP